MSGIRLRRATVDDVPTLERWDADPDVISATTDDDNVDRAFGGLDWRDELSQSSDVSYYLIAELDGRPIGAMQICDPHGEPTHYWGEIEPHLRAMDIWIGSSADRGKGYGAEMMRQAHALCFANPRVTAIVIDPLASNIRAHAFYQRLGYVVVGPRVFGDDLCLVHRLARID
ncbi:MAG: GNAT family N-acetyltransferase [Gemmatimonas sp.]